MLSLHRYQIVNEYLMALNTQTSNRKIENHYGIKWEKIV